MSVPWGEHIIILVLWGRRREHPKSLARNRALAEALCVTSNVLGAYLFFFWLGGSPFVRAYRLRTMVYDMIFYNHSNFQVPPTFRKLFVTFCVEVSVSLDLLSAFCFLNTVLVLCFIFIIFFLRGVCVVVVAAVFLLTVSFSVVVCCTLSVCLVLVADFVSCLLLF